MALACGYASPAKMLRELRPSELGLWAALWRIEPWGEDRADLRSGIVASVMANIWRDSKKKPEPFSAEDFMPYREVEKSADLSAKIRGALLAAGAKGKAKKKP